MIQKTKSLYLSDLSQHEWANPMIGKIKNILAASVEYNTNQYIPNVNLRVGTICGEMDKMRVSGKEAFYGVIPVKNDVVNPYKTFDDVIVMISENPRGTWAIVENEGHYFGLMSNGVGGCVNSIKYSAPDAPTLNYDYLYAEVLRAVISALAFRVEDEIYTHSLRHHQIGVGYEAKGIEIRGKKRNIVIKDLVNGIDENVRIVIFEATYRKKTIELSDSPKAVLSYLGKSTVMPKHYEGFKDLSLSINEKRRMNLNNNWHNIPELSHLDEDRGMLMFTVFDNTAVANIVKKEGEFGIAGRVTIQFEPGTEKIIDIDIAEKSHLGMKM